MENGKPVFDVNGQPVMERRSFFPELGERGAKLVPICHASANSEQGDGVVRQQFPLTLAWALTFYKAQGMTLRRVRIMMSKRSAAQVGLAYVAVTRVKHPRRLMFWTDLPEHAAFQEAKYKEEFRLRQRYILRMEAKASRTLRKYGCCQADLWNQEDSGLAVELLCCLEVDGGDAGLRAGQEGR